MRVGRATSRPEEKFSRGKYDTKLEAVAGASNEKRRVSDL